MRRLALAASLLVLLGAAALAVVGERLSAAAPGMVGPAPAGALVLRIDAGGGDTVAGWLTPGRPGAGAVLLLHGLRADRRQMQGRAQALQRQGYATLLIDLPAHGESSGTRIGFGLHEGAAVRASLRHLRQALAGEKVAVIGVSLGAAAYVLAGAKPAADAVVLESMYADIDDALLSRLRLHAGAVGVAAAPLLRAQLPLWLGISADQLRPVDRLASLRAPLLIVAGSADRHTTPAASRRLHAAAAAPKDLWWVEGAGHVDLHAFDPAAYEARIFAFLARHLRGAAAD